MIDDKPFVCTARFCELAAEHAQKTQPRLRVWLGNLPGFPSAHLQTPVKFAASVARSKHLRKFDASEQSACVYVCLKIRFRRTELLGKFRCVATGSAK